MPRSSTIIPFGKFKGQRLHVIPTSYLEWLVKNVQFKSDKLKAAVHEELLTRDYENDDLKKNFSGPVVEEDPTHPGWVDGAGEFNDFGPYPGYTPGDDDIPF